MTLKAWVALQGGRRKAASLLRVTPTAIHYWLRKKATPRFDTIEEIVKLSGGKVTLKQIFEETGVKERAEARKKAGAA
jgi:hypothetical protein